jgi:Ca2+-binding RTX toxin-like protein
VTQGAYDPHGGASLSADGTKIAFASYANLVDGDNNGTWDVFVKDLGTGAIRRVSTAADGAEANGNSLYGVSLSADGTKVAFASYASNLVADDTNNDSDVFVKDLGTGSISRASTAADGGQGTGGSLYNVSLSSDGSKVAFSSYANNLVSGDTNFSWDTFVKDLTTGAVTRASAGVNGQGWSDPGGGASLSGDGTKVAFATWANNLVANDFDSDWDVFVHDLSVQGNLSGGAQREVLVGSGVADLLTGGGGDDLLVGGHNDDKLMGEAGNDTLKGDSGADSLDGGNDDDILAGGAGPDILIGGAGADVFRINFSQEGVDTINDFVSGTDILEIAATGFLGGLTPGSPVTLVSGVSAADAFSAGSNGYFMFDNDAGDRVLYWDQTGGSGADAVPLAKLLNVTALQPSDFLLV